MAFPMGLSLNMIISAHFQIQKQATLIVQLEIVSKQYSKK